MLVTGATGLVGSHILAQLAPQDSVLYATKRPNANTDIVKELFDFYEITAHFDKIKWISIDLEDNELLSVIPKEVSTIYHTAAFVSFLPNDKDKMYSINVVGTKNLLEWGKKNTLSVFAFVSSIAAIGKTKKGELIKETTVYDEIDSHSPYAVTKFESENLVKSYASIFKVVIINPGVIIGPTDWNKSSGALFKVGHKGLYFYTLGITGFVDVRDVAKGLILLASHREITHANRYIAVGENANFKKLFCTIAKELNKPKPLILAPPILTELGWRIEKIKSKITVKPANLTKETARSSQEVHRFDNTALKKYLGTFISLEDAVANAAKFIRNKYQI